MVDRILAHRPPANPLLRLPVVQQAEASKTNRRHAGEIIGNYVKPLRRKIGVVTLVITCLFAAGWVRSFEQDDYFGIFDVINSREYFFQSANGRLLWYNQKADGNISKPGPPYCVWFTEPLEGLQRGHFVFTDPSILAFRWGMQWFRFGGTKVFSTEPTTLDDGIQLFLPYWSIIIPLTLLSAYLLLDKPTQRHSSIEPQAKA